MGERYFDVDVEVNNDGTVNVTFDGAVEFPFEETVTLEEGEQARVHGEFSVGDGLADQPNHVSWEIRGSDETIANGGDGNRE